MTSAFLPVVPYAILLWDAVVLVLVGREIHFLLLKIAFLPLSQMTFVRHRKVEAWNEGSVRINLAFVFLLISIWILFPRGTPFNPQDQGGLGRGGRGYRCIAPWTVRYRAVKGCLCPSPQEAIHPLPTLHPPWFSGHAV